MCVDVSKGTGSPERRRRGRRRRWQSWVSIRPQRVRWGTNALFRFFGLIVRMSGRLSNTSTGSHFPSCFIVAGIGPDTPMGQDLIHVNPPKLEDYSSEEVLEFNTRTHTHTHTHTCRCFSYKAANQVPLQLLILFSGERRRRRGGTAIDSGGTEGQNFEQDAPKRPSRLLCF